MTKTEIASGTNFFIACPHSFAKSLINLQRPISQNLKPLRTNCGGRWVVSATTEKQTKLIFRLKKSRLDVSDRKFIRVKDRDRFFPDTDAKVPRQSKNEANTKRNLFPDRTCSRDRYQLWGHVYFAGCLIVWLIFKLM